MGKFQFVALRANRHAWGRHPQFLGPPLVASGSRMFMFRIWHRSSSKQPATGKPSGSIRPTDLVFRTPGHPDRRHRRFRGTLTGPLVQIFPASRAKPRTVDSTERLHG